MTQAETPLWQKLLPLVVLLPSAFVPNGSLISLLVVIVTLIAVRTSRTATLAFAGNQWIRNILIGLAGGLALWFLSDRVWEPLLQQWFGPIKLDSVAGVRGNLPNYLMLLGIG